MLVSKRKRNPVYIYCTDKEYRTMVKLAKPEKVTQWARGVLLAAAGLTK